MVFFLILLYLSSSFAVRRSDFVFYGPHESHECGILDNGTAWCTGPNDYRQLGSDMNFPPNFALDYLKVANLVNVWWIGAADEFTCAITGPEGSAYCWGRGHVGQLGGGDFEDASLPQAVPDLHTNIFQMIVSRTVACALQQQIIWCWGKSVLGQTCSGSFDAQPTKQLIQPSTTFTLPFVHLSAYYDTRHTCFVDSTPSVFCCGGANTASANYGVVNAYGVSGTVFLNNTPVFVDAYSGSALTFPVATTTTPPPATERPSAAPTAAPTASPTETPTFAPTKAPTAAPTASPTETPTFAPTKAPTAAPTASPTRAPTRTPTQSPTAAPTGAPTTSPTRSPLDPGQTASPTQSPTPHPTRSPTAEPTMSPTQSPTMSPTQFPTISMTMGEIAVTQSTTPRRPVPVTTTAAVETTTRDVQESEEDVSEFGMILKDDDSGDNDQDSNLTLYIAAGAGSCALLTCVVLVALFCHLRSRRRYGGHHRGSASHPGGASIYGNAPQRKGRSKHGSRRTSSTMNPPSRSRRASAMLHPGNQYAPAAAVIPQPAGQYTNINSNMAAQYDNAFLGVNSLSNTPSDSQRTETSQLQRSAGTNYASALQSSQQAQHYTPIGTAYARDQSGNSLSGSLHSQYKTPQLSSSAGSMHSQYQNPSQSPKASVYSNV